MGEFSVFFIFGGHLYHQCATYKFIMLKVTHHVILQRKINKCLAYKSSQFGDMAAQIE